MSVCLGKCVCVWGVIGPWVGGVGGARLGQVVSQWSADWHHLYCPNNRSIWLSSQASIYPNCIKSNRKNETLIKANQYPAPQLWPEDLGMAGAAVICTLLTPMSATFVSSYTKKQKFLCLKLFCIFAKPQKMCLCGSWRWGSTKNQNRVVFPATLWSS